MTEVFFYGLFMDVRLLTVKGLRPANARMAHLPDYTLKIGNRASLVPKSGERAYGLIISVHTDTLESLYAEASVADYEPEAVEVVLEDGEIATAICYNLPAESLTGTNAVYATALFELGTSIGLPDSYLQKLKKMAQTSDRSQ